MENLQLRKKVEHAFQRKQWDLNWLEKEEILEVRLGEYEKTFEISLPKLRERVSTEQREATELIAELVEQAEIIYNSIRLRESLDLHQQEMNLFPVLRNPSFPQETKEGVRLISHQHTAESMIYYAVDLGESYTLIDVEMLASSGWNEQELKEKSLFNLRRLENQAKEDQVAGNILYFISPTDGYGASRILNQALLADYHDKVEGDFCLAIPHQDVLILADIRNNLGYDVLGQVVMSFYRQGKMPITMLPFDYKQGQLEPIFILAKRK